MESGCNFACGEQPRHRRCCSFWIDAHSPHHVVASGSHFHRTFGDVHVRQFEELVIHAGELFLYVFRRLMRNIQERTAVFRAAAFTYFGIDGTCHDVACG